VVDEGDFGAEDGDFDGGIVIFGGKKGAVLEPFFGLAFGESGVLGWGEGFGMDVFVDTGLSIFV
jgi:hypothetical protein